MQLPKKPNSLVGFDAQGITMFKVIKYPLLTDRKPQSISHACPMAMGLLNKIKEKRKQLTFKLVVFEIISLMMITTQIILLIRLIHRRSSFSSASSLWDFVTVRVHFSFSFSWWLKASNSLTLVEARTKG